MENKNIWIINHYAIPPSLGGLNRHYYFAKELIARGNKVRIFTSSAIHNTDINMIDAFDKQKFKEVEVDGLTYTYIKSSGYKGNGLGRIKNMLGFMFSVPSIRRYRKEKPDIIYTSSPDLFTAFAAVLLAKRLRVKCIVEVRDLWPLSVVEYLGMSPKNPIIVALYQLEKWIYKKASALVFTMEGGKQYIEDKHWEKKINLDKVFSINNGVDYDAQMSARSEFVLSDADLTDDKFKIIYVGSIRKVNNLMLLVNAAELLKDDNNLRFIVYGDGTEKAELENYCAENGLNNVVFKGRVDKKYVPFILSKSNINIVNVHQTDIMKYGCSLNKLFDYFASGKPTVSNLKVNYDLLERYDCGITTDDQSAEAMAEAITKIYRMPKEEYEKMCTNALAAAKAYDFKVLTDKLEEVIEFSLEK